MSILYQINKDKREDYTMEDLFKITGEVTLKKGWRT